MILTRKKVRREFKNASNMIILNACILDFISWKDMKEKEMKCSYVQATGKKINKTYYICHRSVVSQSYKFTSLAQDSQKKLIKSQGLTKYAYTCPSTMTLIETAGKYKATLFTPHFGHECSLKHIHLTKAERRQIAGLCVYQNVNNDILQYFF